MRSSLFLGLLLLLVPAVGFSCPKGQKRTSCAGIKGAERKYVCSKQALKPATVKRYCKATKVSDKKATKRARHAKKKARQMKMKQVKATKGVSKKAGLKAPPKNETSGDDLDSM